MDSDPQPSESKVEGQMVWVGGVERDCSVRQARCLKSVQWGGMFRISHVLVQREGVGFILHEVSMRWAGQFQPVSALWRHLCSLCSVSYTMLFLGLDAHPLLFVPNEFGVP